MSDPCRVIPCLCGYFRRRVTFAYHQSAGPIRKEKTGKKNGESGTEILSSKKGRLREGLHIYTEKAEFRFEESCPGSIDQRDGSDNVHPRCGA